MIAGSAENGRVVKVNGNRAEVEVVPAGVCEHCGAAGVCGWSGDRKRIVLALNPLGARVGDSVVISRPARAATHSALLVFGLPAALMVAGAVIGGLLLSDKWAVVFAGGGLGLAVLMVWLVERARGKSGTALPVIVNFIQGGQNDKDSDNAVGCADGDGKRQG